MAHFAKQRTLGERTRRPRPATDDEIMRLHDEETAALAEYERLYVLDREACADGMADMRAAIRAGRDRDPEIVARAKEVKAQCLRARAAWQDAEGRRIDADMASGYDHPHLSPE